MAPRDQYSADLEELRRRLLDLTARNRLLSYKHPRGRSVRIIQTDPAWFYDHLLAGQSLRVDYIPSPPRGEELDRVWPQWVRQYGPDVRPKVQDWAKFKNFRTSYDLVELVGTGGRERVGRRGLSVQSLYYPEDLERQLGRIAQLARTAIEDSGANVLYVAFGFLEWSDREETTSHLAPLLLVPVRTRSDKYDTATRRKIFSLEYSGEDVQFNLSLQQKLLRDFNLELPELDDDDDLPAYMKKCAKLLRSKPEWSIHYYVTLGFFQFGKLLLYLDLDPARWPQANRLDQHKVVSTILGGSSSDESSDYAALHDPDQIDPNAPEFHLVHSADSSQHSAVIDAAKEDNLVIEGPPGTGKSQTIANIIGVALKKGHSVLFVSEKMAALEVVRSRLEEVGLGDFCLELHSHRTQRSKLLADIRRRLERRSVLGRSGELREEVRRYESVRDRLNEYVRLINKNVPGFSSSVHDLLWAVSNLRHLGGADGDAIDDAPELGEWDEETLDDALARLDKILVRRRLAEEDAGTLCQHPLYGLALRRDAANEWRPHGEALELLLRRLQALRDSASTLARYSNGDIPDTVAELGNVQPIAKALMGPSQVEMWVHLEHLSEAPEVAKRFSEYQRVEEQLIKARANAEKAFATSLLDSPDELAAQVATISQLGGPILAARELTIDNLQRIADSIAALAEIFDECVAGLSEVEGSLGLTLPAGLNGFQAGDELFDVLGAIPVESMPLRSVALESIRDPAALDELETEVNELRSWRSRLNLRFNLDELPEAATLMFGAEILERKGSILGAFDAEWRAANSLYKSLCRQRPLLRRSRKRATDLRELERFSVRLQEFEENPEFTGLLGRDFVGLSTPVKQYRTLIEWYASVRGWTDRWFASAPDVTRAIMRVNDEALQRFEKYESGGLRQSIQQAIWHLRNLTKVAGDALAEDWFGERANAAATATELSADLYEAIPSLRECVNAPEFTPGQAVATAQPYLSILMDTGVCEERKEFLAQEVAPKELPPEAVEALNEAWRFGHAFWSNEVTDQARSVVRIRKQGVSVAQVLESLQKADASLDAYDQTTAEPIRVLGVTPHFCGQPFADTPFQHAISRLEEALGSESTFPAWRDFVIRLYAEGEPPLPWPSLGDQLLSGKLQDKEARATLRLGLLMRISENLLSQHEILREFEGMSHEDLRTRLRQVDERIRELHREEIAQVALSQTPPAGNSSGRVREYTEMGLIRREINKKKRHVPIRRLTQRAGRSLVALKPCFMMGPLSVAQYLPPGGLTFDLVIMDEASQMRPEDSIGAIARARQTVVVGDPRQLPPTSFFDRLEEEGSGDEDDETVVQGQESILELLMPALGRVRQLNWHYRSQHQSLIAFSNEQFYDGRLEVFPSPTARSQDGALGITYCHVDGRYKAQRNPREAEEILRGVLREVRRSGGRRTVGVVAVNSQQADLLNDEWARLIREHPDIETMISTWEERQQPFFIKNLENVQGDERDVIFISLTYGPDENGHVYQRFGPINQQNGWRRLNVLFTRAKQNMVVYSSMRSDQIIPAPGNRGATALRDFVAFCERGGRSKDYGSVTEREPDSPFEEEVIDTLRRHGYLAVPQVGVSGFYIDVGVQHPQLGDDFILGVECDGATYHSAKSARDRDHLRQEILEGLGWRIYRIWSVDWYRRREREVKRLLDAVEGAYLTETEKRSRQEEQREESGLVTADGSAEQDSVIEQYDGSAEEVAQEQAPGERLTESGEDDAEELKESLVRLRETIEQDFPTVPRSRGLLQDDVISLLVEHRPVAREEFGKAVPINIRQSIDIDQAASYLGAVLSLCEEYV